MPLACSKETLVWLYLNATSTFKLIFFFSFILFPISFKLFSSFFRSSDEYDYEEDMPEVVLATEEEEEEGGFGYYSNVQRDLHQHLVENVLEEEEEEEELLSRSSSSSDDLSLFEEPSGSFQVDYLEEEVEEEAMEEDEVIVEDITGREDSYLDEDFEPKHRPPSPIVTIDLSKKNTPIHQEHKKKSVEIEVEEIIKPPRNDEFSMYAASRGEITMEDNQKRHVIFDHQDEQYADSCTVGSTSKDSSDWRSSITFRDSCTEDPFSSSSRRSCPKWESYTVFQKYDEEMTFLDRISAQKLQETETLKSLQVAPRSISQRFVHQFSTTTVSRDKIIPPLQERFHLRSINNPYDELEAAYVAQVCLAWEALSWDYNNFRSKQSLLQKQGTKLDLGCPAQIAQQFQQFQVLLQRYVETEPYEYGKRPEIYARMRRSVAPKLLLVPEYQDYDEDGKKEQPRVTSASFLELIEDSIRTFMNFLSADRENPYHVVLRSLFKKRKRKGSVDHGLVKVLKQANTKKKLKLKELQRPGKCCVKKKNLTKNEEMEILMGLIDLKLVSRVLRMWDLTHEKLRWCEEKMTKLTLSKQGKLQRDSTPLFFPAH